MLRLQPILLLKPPTKGTRVFKPAEPGYFLYGRVAVLYLFGGVLQPQVYQVLVRGGAKSGFKLPYQLGYR